MKKILLTMIAAAMLASCTKEGAGNAKNRDCGFGKLVVAVDGNALLAAETRADAVRELSELGVDVPNAMTELRTLVSCKDTDVELDGNNPWKAFTSATAHNDEEVLYPAADYAVTLGTRQPTGALPHYYEPSTGNRIDNTARPYYAGDASQLVPRIPEGENLPYFEGRTEVTVLDGETAEAEVTVAVANTAVCIEFTEAFRNYFPNGATVQIKTRAAGTGKAGDEKYYQANTFTVGYDGDNDVAGAYVKKYFWVRPQDFTLSGTALRQNPSPGVIDAKSVTLGDYKASGIKPRTLYTYTFDADNAGSTGGDGEGGIVITVNDTPIEVIEEDFELNPSAPKEE